METSSKDYGWRWITADAVLTSVPCELEAACIVTSAAATDTHLYSGENVRGDKIVTMATGDAGMFWFDPPQPVYCRRGLYADVGSNVIGLFVQWRDL